MRRPCILFQVRRAKFVPWPRLKFHLLRSFCDRHDEEDRLFVSLGRDTRRPEPFSKGGSRRGRRCGGGIRPLRGKSAEARTSISTSTFCVRWTFYPPVHMIPVSESGQRRRPRKLPPKRRRNEKRMRRKVRKFPTSYRQSDHVGFNGDHIPVSDSDGWDTGGVWNVGFVFPFRVDS